jgi:drug/metabolite transporter (DMT)-like permease
MLKGILLVFSACFVWGLIFVIPGMMIGFSSLEIALGRYFFLGITSCIFLLIKGFQTWQKFSWSIWRQAIFYALLVNILYYFSLVTGLLYSSASVIALLLGISPITITFYGNWRQKECSYRQLILPCVLIGCGLICVNWSAFTSLPAEASWRYGFGLLCGFFSLIIWNWYVIANTDFLKKNRTVSSSDWSTLIGVATFLWVVIICLILFFLAPADYLGKYFVLNSALISFLFGGLVLGLICSWLGSYFWNVGSQALPMSLAGQLTIFETIFGLIFVYLLEQRLPTMMESIGILTILGGVSLSMMRFNRSSSSVSAPLHSLS